MLHWIKGAGEYNLLVTVSARLERQKLLFWRHLPIHENPVDLGVEADL